MGDSVSPDSPTKTSRRENQRKRASCKERSDIVHGSCVFPARAHSPTAAVRPLSPSASLLHASQCVDTRSLFLTREAPRPPLYIYASGVSTAYRALRFSMYICTTRRVSILYGFSAIHKHYLTRASLPYIRARYVENTYKKYKVYNLPPFCAKREIV